MLVCKLPVCPMAATRPRENSKLESLGPLFRGLDAVMLTIIIIIIIVIIIIIMIILLIVIKIVIETVINNSGNNPGSARDSEKRLCGIRP